MPRADAAFVEETFQAVLALLEDARDHISAGMAPDMPVAQRMRAAQELSRLTNRATAAMSLVLLAKALEAGQEVGGGDIAVQAAGILEDILKRPAVPPAGPAEQAELPADVAALVVRGDGLFTRMSAIHDHIFAVLAGGA